jgi:hypothetical protein
VQTVGVPGEYDIDRPGADLADKVGIAGAWLAGVSRDVIVGVDGGDGQAETLRQGAALGLLPCDA